ncbi:MAG: uncharacterized protein K0S58_2507 [Nitrospira sp.]|nr:uncharacterized protein [Nitrospira sp.]
MEKEREGLDGRRWVFCAVAVVWAAGLAMTGCARLPYTTRMVHEDERVVVTAQQEVEPRMYTHPVQLTNTEVASLTGTLRGPGAWLQPSLSPRHRRGMGGHS